MDDAYTRRPYATTGAVSTSAQVADRRPAPAVPAALAGAVTPELSLRDCFTSSALSFVLRASPVPRVEVSLSAPAASLARIWTNTTKIRTGHGGTITSLRKLLLSRASYASR